MSRLEIRQRKSSIGEKRAAKGTLQSLGLKRPGHTVSSVTFPLNHWYFFWGFCLHPG